MSFVYSLKLFGSNWAKALKLFLYYIVIWGLCIVLLLPVFFTFKNIFINSLSSIDFSTTFSGAILGSIGKGINIFALVSREILLSVFSFNIPLAIYGLFVGFILLPFLLNVGKYTFCEMLYLYMTSKAKVGFFSALVKSLRNSVCYAICKTFHNLLFFAIVLVSGYYIASFPFLDTLVILFLWSYK